MNRAALALALVAASSSVAAAGGYLGLGIGTSAISDDQDRLLEKGRSGRLLVGTSFGRLSIEGSFNKFGMTLDDQNRVGGAPFDIYYLGAAVKYSLPLGSGFGAFGRVGLQHTWVTGEIPEYSSSGNGFLIGAGFDYQLKLNFLAQSSIWVDYQINKTKTDGDRLDFDATARMWTLGLTIGI